MHCKTCNFIMKGVETKCPYCGTPFEKELFLDKKFHLFKNMTLTVRQLISIICINVVAMIMLFDIIYKHTVPENISLHLTPWVFAGVFGSMFILNNFILRSADSNKLLFFKFLIFSVVFSVLFLISYRNEPLFTEPNYLMIIGYLYPITIIILIIGGVVRFLIKRYYNIFSTVVYVLLNFIFAGVLFILSFIEPIGISSNSTMKLIITIAFIFACVILFNAFIFTILTLKSKVTSED